MEVEATLWLSSHLFCIQNRPQDYSNQQYCSKKEGSSANQMDQYKLVPNSFVRHVRSQKEGEGD
jgi:hypothetical protein